MITRLAIPFSLITLIVIAILRVNPGNAQEIESYHKRVIAVVNSIPIDVKGWVGQQVPLPESATNLLRPNALVARQYFHMEKGVSATLMVVQTKDIRDMAGHYPPRCYPANGWMVSEDNPVGMFTLEDQGLRKYGFHRVVGQVKREITVYSLFALPTGKLTTSMRDVRRLSADYEYRKFGAAQLQVVIDGEVDQEDHLWILKDMYEIALPAIEAVLEAAPETELDEGGVS